MYYIRFNLGRGENYMKWKVKGANSNKATYYNPEDYVLFLMGAKLTNRPTTAKRIYAGDSHKTVCAWIKADHIIVYRRDEVPEEYYNAYNQPQQRLSYNPRVAPYWRNAEGENVDNRHYKVLCTLERGVFNVPQG